MNKKQQLLLSSTTHVATTSSSVCMLIGGGRGGGGGGGGGGRNKLLSSSLEWKRGRRNYSSAFHQDHVIESSTIQRKYLTNIEFMRKNLKHFQQENSLKAKHEQNIGLLLNNFSQKWNNISIRNEVSLIRRKLVNCQQSYLKNDRTILSSSNIKQALQGSQHYLNNPNERRIVLQERENMLRKVDNMFREAKNNANFVNILSNDHSTTTTITTSTTTTNTDDNSGSEKTLTFDVHLLNMFIDIYLRLRSTDQIWEMERFMERREIQPNLTTLIFLTDASRVDNQVDKAIQYYRKAITQWSDCIELDTSYWNHFLSALALIGSDQNMLSRGGDVVTNNNNNNNNSLTSTTTTLAASTPPVQQENELLSKYFSIMIDSGYEPDEDTFRFVIHGSRNINIMMEILDLMENEYGLYYLKCYDSISFFLSNSNYNPKMAKSLFHRLLKNREQFKDPRSGSAFFLDNSNNSSKVVGGLENVSPSSESALEFKYGLNMELSSIYQHLIHSFIPPNYSHQVEIDTMLTIYDYAVTREKLKPTTVMMEDLIDAYCRVGNMKEAWVILQRMRSLNLFRTNSIKVHWKLLMAYKHQKDVKGASTVMKDALEKRVAITEGLIKLYLESCRTTDDMTPLVVFCALIDRKFVDISQHKYFIPLVRDVFQNVKKKFGVVHKQQINDIDSEQYGEFAKFQKVTSMLQERYVKFH